MTSPKTWRTSFDGQKSASARPAHRDGAAVSAQSPLWPRADLARWERSFSLTGHHLGPGSHRTDSRGHLDSGHLAANLSLGMRYQTPRAAHNRYRHGRLSNPPHRARATHHPASPPSGTSAAGAMGVKVTSRTRRMSADVIFQRNSGVSTTSPV